MTSSDLRANLKALGLSDRGFALVAGTTARTVRRWKAGTQDVPARALAAIEMLRRSPMAAAIARERQRETDGRYRHAPLDNPAPVE